jgi:EMC6
MQSQQIVYDLEALQNNVAQIQTSRAVLALVSGWVAGLLGLNNFEGFLFYLLPSALFSLILFLRTKGKVDMYFPSLSFLTTSFLLPNLPSYLAAWVFTYGICLVYA